MGGSKLTNFATRLSLSAGCIFAAVAQDDPAPEITQPEFVLQNGPLPMYRPQEEKEYNLRWGELSGRLSNSLSTEFNDNIDLRKTDRNQDLIIAPGVSVGFLYPISQDQMLRFDIGAGYRLYLDNSHLNSVHLSPDSRFDYRFRVAKADVVVYEQFYVQTDPVARPEVSGVTQRDSGIFRRFNNTAGIRVDWPIIRRASTLFGYDHVMDRSLSSGYKDIDRYDHIFTAGVFHPLGSRLNVGISSTYTIIDFVKKVQNDGQTFSIGPTATWKASKFITLNSGVSYTQSEFEQNGTIQDQSDFTGLTYFATITHTLNRRMSHYLRVSKTINPGLGSNYTDLLAMQYGFTWQARGSLTFTSSFAYETFETSGNLSEEAERYLWYISAGVNVSRALSANLAYALALKESNFSDRDYYQNRVVLDLRYEF